MILVQSNFFSLPAFDGVSAEGNNCIEIGYIPSNVNLVRLIFQWHYFHYFADIKILQFEFKLFRLATFITKIRRTLEMKKKLTSYGYQKKCF